MSNMIRYFALITLAVHVHTGNPTCTNNCTLQENLPCSITEYTGFLPNFGIENPRLWPGKPEKFDHMIYYELKDQDCVPYLNVSWVAVNDGSRWFLRGFALSQISLYGPSVNMRKGLVFNLTQANWTDEDMRKPLIYSQHCWEMIAPTIQLILSPLPIPPYKQNDRIISIRIDAPEVLKSKGKCVLVSDIPTKSPRTTTTSSATRSGEFSATSTSFSTSLKDLSPRVTAERGTEASYIKNSSKIKWTTRWIVMVTAVGVVSVGTIVSLIYLLVRGPAKSSRNGDLEQIAEREGTERSDMASNGSFSTGTSYQDAVSTGSRADSELESQSPHPHGRWPRDQRISNLKRADFPGDREKLIPEDGSDADSDFTEIIETFNKDYDN